MRGILAFIQSLRAFRRAVLFGLVAWWVVGLLSLRLSVCSFDHGGFLRTFWELAWGLLGSILGAWGVAWAPFWGLWAPLGLHFGGLGPPWASFLGLWGFSGAFGAPWVAPLAAQGAQSEIFLFFPFHFGVIFGTFWS